MSMLLRRFGGLYTDENVVISGIHTHSGPGGYLQYVTYAITSLGFVRQSFDALVDGIERSIVQAQNNLRRGNLYLNEGRTVFVRVGCQCWGI
jgi:neutral ceramidase